MWFFRTRTEVTNSNSDEQILKRLLQTSTDMQILDTALFCVATADFTSTQYSLDTAEDEEHRVFHHFVQDHVNTLTCVGVSEWKVFHCHMLLSRSLTNEALVVQLANKMHEHIQQDWKPLSNTLLAPAVQSLMNNNHQLGDPVDCYTAQGILDAVNNEVTLTMRHALLDATDSACPWVKPSSSATFCFMHKTYCTTSWYSLCCLCCGLAACMHIVACLLHV